MKLSCEHENGTAEFCMVVAAVIADMRQGNCVLIASGGNGGSGEDLIEPNDDETGIRRGLFGFDSVERMDAADVLPDMRSSRLFCREASFFRFHSYCGDFHIDVQLTELLSLSSYDAADFADMAFPFGERHGEEMARRCDGFIFPSAPAC